MAPTPHTTALALRCRPAGTLIEITYDELGVTPRAAPGKPFANIFAASGLRKAGRFLRTIQASHAALDWELDVALPHGVAPLFFSGCAIDRSFLVIATKSPLSETGVPGGLTKIAGADAERVAPAIAELNARAEAKAKSDHVLASHLSRLHDALALARQPIQKTRAVRKAGPAQIHLLQLAAHDLRNPVSGVLAASEYLLEDAAGQLEEHHMALLKSIESSSRLILRLIEEMLEIPAHEPKKLRVDLQSTNIASLVEQSVSENRVLADTRKVRLDLKADERGPFIEVDPLKVSRAVHDLVTSAIRGSRPGSRIEVRVFKRAGNAVISAREEGPAFATQESAADRTKRSSTEARTAIMLANVKRIVERHHGAMHVENRAGVGSTYTITLPAHTPRRAPVGRRRVAST